MSNYSFFQNSIRLPLVILNLRAFSSKSSYFIFNINEELLQDVQQTNQLQYNPIYDAPNQNFIRWCKKRLSSLLESVCQKLFEEGIYLVLTNALQYNDCLDPRCYTCAIQFATLADRKEHEKVVCKRQKKKQRDNDTIAVNLATMDTCGDCDDEDA
jgi:hypothetical protein